MTLRAALEPLVAPFAEVVAVVDSAAVIYEDLVAVQVKFYLPDVVVVVALAVVSALDR